MTAAPSRLPGGALLPALLLVLLATVPADVAAQVEAAATLRGQVLEGDAPLDSGTVVLHRVARDTAGRIDSVRVADEGRFSFSLPTVPDPGGRDDVYFASVRHQGILYFGEAIVRAVQLDSLYVLEVHDTASAPAAGADLPVAVRYMIAEPLTPSGWQVTDLFQVVNPGDRTLVPPGDGPVWSYPLAEGATEVQVGGGDVGPEAAGMGEGGRLEVRAPIPPGDRQLIVRYLVEDQEVALPLPGRTDHVELLVPTTVEEMEVTGLSEGELVEMAPGSEYVRFIGDSILDGRVVLTGSAVGPQGAAGGGGLGISGRWLAVLLAFLLAGAGLWAVLGRGGEASKVVAPGTGDGPTAPLEGESPGEARRALLLEIARLDERIEGEEDDAERARLESRRRDLLARLRDLGRG